MRTITALRADFRRLASRVVAAGRALAALEGVNHARTVGPEAAASPARAILPPDVQKVVDDFLNHPDRKADVRRVVTQAVAFFARAKEVGPFVALAESDDREFRMAMARTLHGLYAANRGVGPAADPG